jgi:sugar phosphate isomerase/epimerase
MRNCLSGQALPLIELASELAVSGLELSDERCLSEDEMSEIERRIRSTEVRVISMHVRCWSTPSEGAVPPSALDQARSTLDRASRLGAEMVTFVNNPPPLGAPVEEVRRSFERCVDQLIPEALQRGLRPTFNNPGSLAKYFGQAQYLKQLCEKYSPHAGMTFDIGNWMLAGESVHEALDLLAPWLSMVHLKDWTIIAAADSDQAALRTGVQRFARRLMASPVQRMARFIERLIGLKRFLSSGTRGIDGTWYLGAEIGEGVLDHRAILSHLKRLNFKGYYCVEYEGKQDPAVALRNGINLVQQILTEELPQNLA